MPWLIALALVMLLSLVPFTARESTRLRALFNSQDFGSIHDQQFPLKFWHRKRHTGLWAAITMRRGIATMSGFSLSSGGVGA